jgi:hypothetical protein
MFLAKEWCRTTSAKAINEHQMLIIINNKHLDLRQQIEITFSRQE